MARAKATELNPNAHQARPYVAPDMRGRVRHDVIWSRTLCRWKPGLKSYAAILELFAQEVTQ